MELSGLQLSLGSAVQARVAIGTRTDRDAGSQPGQTAQSRLARASNAKGASVHGRVASCEIHARIYLMCTTAPQGHPPSPLWRRAADERNGHACMLCVRLFGSPSPPKHPSLLRVGIHTNPSAISTWRHACMFMHACLCMFMHACMFMHVHACMHVFCMHALRAPSRISGGRSTCLVACRNRRCRAVRSETADTQSTAAVGRLSRDPADPADSGGVEGEQRILVDGPRHGFIVEKPMFLCDYVAE